ncbi:MAG: hypothetical protein NVS3B11_08490 [Collimonas sp.]
MRRVRAVSAGSNDDVSGSFVEATPRYNKKDKFTVSIELTDFSVYYTQGAADAASLGAIPWRSR